MTLCDPIDGSPPGSPIPGIFQARMLEWVAISFSSAWKWKVKVKSLSCVQLLGTPRTVAHQAPPSMGFSRQEYWSGLPLPSPFSHLSSQYPCVQSCHVEPSRYFPQYSKLSQVTAFCLILSLSKLPSISYFLFFFQALNLKAETKCVQEN